MDNYLKSLHQSYVFAYILDYQPPKTLVDHGVMTIVDNNDNKISYLLSYYGFYIDNVFIAGGHGFRNFEDIQKAKDIIDNFDNIQDEISENFTKLYNKKTVFEFNGTETFQNGDHPVDLNILSPEYNSYNYITSYKYFKVDEIDNVPNPLDYKYTLSIHTQNDLRYIENINIEPNNGDNQSIDVENINATNTQKYKVKLTINQNTSSNIIQENEDLKLYLYSRISEERKNDEIKYNTEASNIVLSYEFNKPINSFDDDLILELRKSSAEPNEENVVYSYIIHNFLKWQDKFTMYPISGDNILENINNYNFRDTNTDLNSTSTDINTTFKTLVNNIFQNSRLINVDTSNEIELEFSSNTPVYDYLIFRNQYTNIEFYFNGLQSHNWVCESIDINSKTYYIRQSPQKYVGNHTWKIKINL